MSSRRPRPRVGASTTTASRASSSREAVQVSDCSANSRASTAPPRSRDLTSRHTQWIGRECTCSSAMSATCLPRIPSPMRDKPARLFSAQWAFRKTTFTDSIWAPSPWSTPLRPTRARFANSHRRASISTCWAWAQKATSTPSFRTLKRCTRRKTSQSPSMTPLSHRQSA